MTFLSPDPPELASKDATKIGLRGSQPVEGLSAFRSHSLIRVAVVDVSLSDHHHHTGLGLLTPADVHHGRAEQRVAARAIVLATAYATHPERFPAGPPAPGAMPTEVWINPPKRSAPAEVALAH